VGPNDRARLEQLCRYVPRPPLAEDRLRRLADGRVRLAIKLAWGGCSWPMISPPLASNAAKEAAFVTGASLRIDGSFAARAPSKGPIMGKLEGKVAVITGGTSGIGLATAKRFVAEGAHVFVTGRRQNELDAAVKQIGKNVSSVQGDVSNLSDLDRLNAKAKQQQGRIDILFANAGLGEFVPLAACVGDRSEFAAPLPNSGVPPRRRHGNSYSAIGRKFTERRQGQRLGIQGAL